MLPDANDVPQGHAVHKIAEVVSKTSAHALVVFADSKKQCQYFASPHLQTEFPKPAAATLLAAGTAIPGQSNGQVPLYASTQHVPMCLRKKNEPLSGQPAHSGLGELQSRWQQPLSHS